MRPLPLGFRLVAGAFENAEFLFLWVYLGGKLEILSSENQSSRSEISDYRNRHQNGSAMTFLFIGEHVHPRMDPTPSRRFFFLFFKIK